MKQLFPSLPDAPELADVFRQYKDTVRPLLEFHDILMRDKESELSVGVRELIAAYVSGLNACQYCFGAHAFAARAMGIEVEVIEALLADRDSAPVEDRIKPILAYAEKLTRTPSMLTQADAQAVYDAGWSEAALYDAVQVTALYNFMNRIVEGTGVAPYPLDPKSVSADALAQRRERSYMDFGRAIGAILD